VPLDWGIGQRPYPVEMLSRHEARGLLAVYAGMLPEALHPDAEEVLDGCAGLPLALAICGAMVGQGIPITIARR
jgi:hypothetical protein